MITKLQPDTWDRAEWLLLLSLAHAVALLHQLRHFVQHYLWVDKHQNTGEVEQHVQRMVEELQSFFLRLTIDLH